ncbi:hypothetical protein DPMN_127847 [Dreissena polymorpha]|uniref:Uncharacterized protein n=1 Tax=Dreissena polymorpha TaxID=45954 RepID=A0A9D4H1X6_DREPO|nr:hypothetical protein DPMN_127847 [Dreissena polymorpha]
MRAGWLAGWLAGWRAGWRAGGISLNNENGLVQALPTTHLQSIHAEQNGRAFKMKVLTWNKRLHVTRVYEV